MIGPIVQYVWNVAMLVLHIFGFIITQRLTTWNDKIPQLK